MTKIEDIAKAAGVSTATVSRVLNNTARVSPETRSAVLQASHKLGRALDPEITRKRVLVICISTGQVLMEPLMRAAADFNISLLFKVIYPFSLTVKDIAFDGSFDGVLLIDSVIGQAEMSQLQKHTPVVECRNYNYLTNEVSALVDDFAIGYDLTMHLIETGKTHVAFSHLQKEIMQLPHARERYRGFLAALGEYHLKPAAEYHLEQDDASDRMLADAKYKWDALIFPEPLEQIDSFKQSLIQSGHDIPNHVAIASLGDGLYTQEADITAMNQPLEAIARGSLFLLDSLMNQRLPVKESMQLRFKPSLVVRGSTVIQDDYSIPGKN